MYGLGMDTQTGMILLSHPDARKYREFSGYRPMGYWWSERQPQLPDPSQFIDLTWDSVERDGIARYLDAAPVLVQWRGESPCRLCAESSNGSTCRTDLTFVWPEGLSHYLREHGVRLPAEFVEHVKTRGIPVASTLDERMNKLLGRR